MSAEIAEPPVPVLGLGGALQGDMATATQQASKSPAISSPKNKEKTEQVADEVPVARSLDKSLFAPLEDPTGGQMREFLDEYARLQENLRFSHDTENKFVNKCRDLSRTLQQFDTEIKKLNETAADNKHHIWSLKSSIVECDSRKTNLEDLQANKKKEIKLLQEAIDELKTRLVNSNEELMNEQEAMVGQLESQIEDRTAKRDKDRTKLNKKRMENITLLNQMQALEATRDEEEAEIGKVQEKFDAYEQQVQEEQGRKETLEQEAAEYKQLMAEHMQQLTLKNDFLTKARQELENAQKQLDDAQNLVMENSRELDSLEQKADIVQDELIMQNEDNVVLKEALETEKKEIKRLQTNLGKGRRDRLRKLSSLEVLRKMFHSLETEHAEQETKLHSWTSKLKGVEVRLATVRAHIAMNSKKMDTYVREREVIHQHHASKVLGVKETQTAIFVAESTCKSVANELASFAQVNKHLEKIINQLKQDKLSYLEDLKTKELRKAKALEKVAERDLDILGYKKQILENESTLKQQQNLLEAVRADRNLYNKTLIEQKEEIQEYRRKFLNLNHQIKQIKMELHEKDQSFITEHFNTSQVDKDVLIIRGKIEGINKRRCEAEKIIAQQKKQIDGLSRIITGADEELKMQTKHLNAVVNEQRVLSQQLVEKNEELGKLYETLRLLNSMFKKGELAYKDKTKARTELEKATQEMQDRLEEIEMDKEQFAQLKAMIQEMENELLQEKLKVRALTDELQKPINVHRWRRLKDTDPETFQMINKVHSLNKQIITRAEEIDRKDQLIQQREKLYVDLRRILARQPGNEAREQLRLYAQSIQEKRSKYKVMQMELKQYQNKMHEFRYQIDILNKDIGMQKYGFFTMMRKERKRKDAAQGMAMDTQNYSIPLQPSYMTGPENEVRLESPPPPPTQNLLLGLDDDLDDVKEPLTPSPPPTTGGN